MCFKRLLLATAIASTLAACGGGSSDNPAVSAPQTISGSAAVGAPLVGAVTVKDALGATKTVTIGSNGAYSVDVTGMTAPFVFRATGTANGQTYTVYSIATAGDGKINITQLTDLVVANIAGQIAQNYFDKFEQNSNATAASKAAIDAEVAKLKEKLLPILTALGVDSAVDLLRTPFTPLSDKLDKALDAIHISVDSATNLATITSVLSSSTIYDDLTLKASAENSPATLSDDVTDATEANQALTDSTAVTKALTDFAAMFATALPTVASLKPMVTTNFLADDENSDAFLGFVSTQPNFIGATFSDIEIHKIDYSDTTKITANVSFSIKTKDGIEWVRLHNWKVRKDTDGVWRLHGNQRVLDLDAFANATKFITVSSSCVSVGLHFNIEDIDTTNNGGTISYILVTGAGLPSGGLRYNKPSTGGRWTNVVTGQSNYALATDCASGTSAGVADDVIAALPDDAIYTFTAYNSSDAAISFPRGTSDGTYKLKIRRRPLTLAEAKASAAFPVIGQQTATDFSAFTSGTLQVAASNVNPTKSAKVRLVQETSLVDTTRDINATVLPTTTGTVAKSLTLPALGSGDSLTSSMLWVNSPDMYRRVMQTRLK